MEPDVLITVVQRPPDIDPKNSENESKKVYVEFTQGNVSTYFSIITSSIFPN
jgi:hypothetical protein